MDTQSLKLDEKSIEELEKMYFNLIKVESYWSGNWNKKALIGAISGKLTKQQRVKKIPLPGALMRRKSVEQKTKDTLFSKIELQKSSSCPPTKQTPKSTKVLLPNSISVASQVISTVTMTTISTTSPSSAKHARGNVIAKKSTDSATQNNMNDSSLKPNRENLEAKISDTASATSKVCVLYTGGTIGMGKSPNGYIPIQGFLPRKVRTLPMFHDTEVVCPSPDFLAMPISTHNKRVFYRIISYHPLLDSSNMSSCDWIRIAKDIEKYYSAFDAFVILHGTDTMSYTASIFSFMLKNLTKTVILTGSQIPLSEPRNDAMDNFLNSLYIAGHYTIPEVCLCFGNRLYRGNRTTKMHASDLDAFCSPNLDPLAIVGTSCNTRWDLVRSVPLTKISPIISFSDNITILTLYPGPFKTIHNILADPLKGLVLQTFGAGNAPDTNKHFLDSLKKASKRGVVIVNITQCMKGHVEGHYATGAALTKAGVVCGGDMTTEAAVTKLGWLLSQKLTPEEVRRKMTQNLRGEMTPEEDNTFSRKSFVRAAYTALRFSSSGFSNSGSTRSKKDTRIVYDSLWANIMCSAAASGALTEIKLMVNQGAKITSSDYDGRTPLHLACSRGHVEVVEYLLTSRANPNAIDGFGSTPLKDALMHGHTDIIQRLRNHNAMLLIPTPELARHLCQASKDNNLEFLKRLYHAGADLNSADYDGRTALHVAASENKIQCVKLLRQQGAQRNNKDRWGCTALDNAKSINANEIVNFLENWIS